jgi:hypothetical protein
MPYDGEFAGYQPLRRVAESESVKQLLRKSRVFRTSLADGIQPTEAPPPPSDLPDLVIAIDGSKAEVKVNNGYPGAEVGYLSVASVLLNLAEIDRLDAQRPADPRAFRLVEEASTVDAAMPGSNVVTGTQQNARDSFREAIFDVLHDRIVDEQDRSRLLETYEALLALKPQAREGQHCPYDVRGCLERFHIDAGVKNCRCSERRPIFPTDALRIHEGFRDIGGNGEAFGEIMQVWERLLLVHLLRCLERKDWLKQTNRLAFFIDGPLAVFGRPAWLSAAISHELKRLNAKAREATGQDLVITEPVNEFETPARISLVSGFRSGQTDPRSAC